MLAFVVKLRRHSMPVLAAWAMLSVWSAITLGQAATEALPSATETSPSAADPHWSKDACGTCHGSKVGPIAATVVTALCLSCHDGVHATDEAHPVGRLMSASVVDPGWPTVSGTVQCFTCHDVKQQCDATVDRPQDNASFLRQAADGTTTFCANCHRDSKIAKFNPHMMLQADRHTPIEPRCDVCHDKPMDTSAMTRSGDASLRADQVTLCRSCHPHHKDISPMGHVLTVIPPEMLAYMRAREITGLLEMPSQDLIKQLQTDHAKPTLMVPNSLGQVVCSTCHNPHEQGTFAPDSVLSDRSLRLIKGHLMTPTRGELFCRHCHSV
jgi:hypothetical protein